MITSDDMQQWAYLLSPTFQVVNSAGKPITGGWLEVYIHGTRTKYYCVSDWDGTLHPFKIPLDSLGSNIVLASPANAYDVYVYNRFGSLIMSRYNVIPSTGGASGVIPSTITIVSDDDTVNVSVSGNTYNLSIGDTVDKLNTVSGDVEELKEAIASGIDQVQVDWEQTDSSKVDYIKNKPDLSIYATNELVETVSGNIVNLVNEGDTNLYNLVSSVSSNLETEISNVSGDIITTVNVVSGTLQDEMVSVSGELVELINTVSSEIPEQEQSDWDEEDTTSPSYIQNKPDLTIYATNGDLVSVSGTLKDEIESVSSNIPDISNLASKDEVNTVSGILETEIQIVSGAIPDVSDFVTHSEVNNVSGILESEIQIVSGAIPSLSGYATETYVDNKVVSAISVSNNYTDEQITEVNNTITSVSGDITNIIETVSGNLENQIQDIPEQVNSDWSAVSGKAEILNKPDLSVYATNDSVSSVSSILNDKINSVSSAIPDVSEYATHTEVNNVSGILENEIQIVSAAIPEVGEFATHSEVNNVSGAIINIVNSVSTTIEGDIGTASGNLVDLIEEVSANIPQAQVQSDWTEDDTSSPAYIKHKPNESTLIAGDNISIVASGDDYVISASGTDLSDYATHTEVNNVSGAIINVVNNVSSTLDGKIDTVSSAIPDVSSFATRNEVNGVSGVLESEIQIVSAAIPDISDLVDTSTLTSVSGNIITTVNNVSSVLNNNIETASGNLVELIATVSSEIPEQVQSNWNETDTSDPSYIQNKPDLSVYATNTDLQIVSSAIPDVSNFSTKTEVNSVSSILENEIQAISGAIPEPFEGYTSPSGTSYIDNVNYTIEQSNSAIGYITTYDWRARWQFSISSVPVQGSSFTPSTREVKFVTYDNIDGEIRLANNYEMTDYISGYFNSGSEEVVFNLPESWVGNSVYFYYNGDTSAYQITVYTKDGNPISTEGVRRLAWEDDLITVSASIPDVSDLVSEGELVSAINVITSTIPQAQVQSNWAETDNTDPSYIQNKPDEINIVAGSGINIVASGTDLVISASATQQVPNVNIVSPSGSIVVGSSIDPLTNTKTFSIDVATASGVEYGQFYATNVTGVANVAKTKGNLSVNNGKIQLHKGQSYHVTVRGTYTQTTLANELSFFNFVEYISFRNMAVNVNKTISASQYWEISYDLYNLAADTDYIVSFNNVSNAVLTDIFVEVHSLAGGNGTGGSASGVEYTAGYGIQILNDVISVSGIKPQVNADWDAVSGVSQVLNKPTEVELIAGSGINITESNNQLIISSTVTGGGATYQEGYGIDIDDDTINVNTAVIPNSNMVSAIASAYASGGGGSGVNYNAGDHIDITNNTISVTGITELVAGSNITITMNSDSAVISAAGGQQVQSDWDEWDSSSPAYIQNKPSIPQSPVQSDWNESDPYSLAYIQNKPNISEAYTGASGIAIDNSVVSLDEPLGIVAGSGINIVIEGDSAIICVSGVSAGGTEYQEGYGIDITNDTISVDTTVIPAVSTVSAMIGVATASIPSQVNADWSATSGVAEILNKPTEVNLLAGSGINVTEASGNIFLDWFTSAGITDIVYTVSAVPNPDPHILYLIPEA